MNVADLCFFDFETRAEPLADEIEANVKSAGTYRYAKRSFATILTYAIGDGPVHCEEMFDVNGDFLVWDEMPDDLHDHYQRATRGAAWFAAWNAGFDRQAWNEGTYGFPLLRPEMTIDVMAQAVASNLPASLEGASQFLRLGGKQPDGKALIKLFSSPDGGTPQSHPEEWKLFKTYGVRDTALLREVFRGTRALEDWQWQEYWASERINDRGMMIDVELCRKAAAVAEVDIARTNALLDRYTNGQIRTVNQHQKIAEWVWDQLSTTEARNLLVSEYDDEADPETGEEIRFVKLSMERSRVTTLIAYFHAQGELSDRDATILKVLELREFGASAAPKKFRKMLDQNDGGYLKGGYVWNGAPQTGRFSSKGVQVHNMTRSVLGPKGKYEAEAIEMIHELEV